MPTAQSRTTKVRSRTGGRVVIPARFRNALGLKEHEVLFAHIENGEIHLLTATAAMRRAQAIVRQFVPESVGLVDELINERRREARRERRRG
jgi:bifunctional DNA-binding transcriptional regulator/antitoxin component of YhaV-PrlF toxin-antitoxin module